MKLVGLSTITWALVLAGMINKANKKRLLVRMVLKACISLKVANVGGGTSGWWGENVMLQRKPAKAISLRWFY